MNSATTTRRFDASWFDQRLRQRGLSRRGLARSMHCDAASVYRLFHGVRPLRLDEASEIANLIGAPVGDVLQHAGVDLDVQRKVPLAGCIDGLGHVELHDKPGSHVLPPTELPPTAIALQARHAGGPTDGWVFFLERAGSVGVPQDIAGRVAVCRLDSGVTLLRTVRRGYQPGTWNLDSLHGAGTIENARLTWAQPVVCIRT